MADNVQWIKMKVGMFDGESFKRIKKAKIGGLEFRDKLTAVWFELMDLADLVDLLLLVVIVIISLALNVGSS